MLKKKVGYWIFPISCYPGNTGGGRAAPGATLQGLDYFWNMFPGISGYPGNIGNMFFSMFCFFFSKQMRAEISRRMHRRMSRDLSYETDSGQKLKLFQTPISRGRRRRRRADNSPIWPDPWTITPRDQISRSGSIPHFD